MENRRNTSVLDLCCGVWLDRNVLVSGSCLPTVHIEIPFGPDSPHTRTMKRSEANTFDPLVDHIADRMDLSFAHVLDLGCGSGGISEAISRHCEDLTSTDITRESVRKALEKTGPGTAGCQLDAKSLPFVDDTFDLVILNGVLEWVPDAHTGDPRDVQVETLREINRVLKPSAMLYMGIEARFYAKYLAGMRDHSGLRFAAPLPRPIANLYSKAVRDRPYRNYLYTIRGYRKLLSEGGFTDVEPASALPSYKWPQRIVSFDEFDEMDEAIDSIDEPGWRRTIRKVLSVHPALFGLFGTEFVFTARTTA